MFPIEVNFTAPFFQIQCVFDQGDRVLLEAAFLKLFEFISLFGEALVNMGTACLHEFREDEC